MQIWEMINLIATQRSRTLLGDQMPDRSAETTAEIALTLANAAHLGGVLVHGHGVQAPITAPTSMGTVIDGADNETHDDDDDD